MAKTFFAYLPAMMRYTYHGWTEDYAGWEGLLENMTSSMAISEIEVMIDEVDRVLMYSDSEDDLGNFVRSIGGVAELPNNGSYGEHFSVIRQVLARKLAA